MESVEREPAGLTRMTSSVVAALEWEAHVLVAKMPSLEAAVQASHAVAVASSVLEEVLQEVEKAVVEAAGGGLLEKAACPRWVVLEEGHGADQSMVPRRTWPKLPCCVVEVGHVEHHRGSMERSV